jgi:hypothetical protein
MSKLFNFENISNIKTLSLNEAVENGFKSWYSNICRWYSRNFYTPLLQVEEMPPEVVLKTYYDDVFYKLINSSEENAQKAIQEEIESLVRFKTNPLEAEMEKSQREKEDDEWYEKEIEKLNKQFEEKENKNANLKNNQEPNLNKTDNAKDKEFVEFDDPPPTFDED